MDINHVSVRPLMRSRRPKQTERTKPRGAATRLATPFTIKCLSCATYIYKNKRHNATKEVARGKDYLGVESYRFHIKCTGCGCMLSIRTDPQHGTYVAESGCARTDEPEALEQDKAEDVSLQLRRESDMKDEINRLRVQAGHVNSSSPHCNSTDGTDE